MACLQPSLEMVFPRSCTLYWQNGYRVNKNGAPQVSCQEIDVENASSIGDATRSPVFGSSVPLTREPLTPVWIKHAGQILRFIAYFDENVPNSPEESLCIRTVRIYHFLEDGTTQIEEPHDQEGIVQGTLLKRMRIHRNARPDDHKMSAEHEAEYLDSSDFCIGSSIRVYGRLLHIVDADQFTRDFYAAQGKPQPAAQPIPRSPIIQYREARSKPSGLKRSDPQSPSRFADSLLGRAPSTKKLQQFLTGNMKVLRCFAVMDEPPSQDTKHPPIRHYFKIHYFLEDNTMEIIENDELEADQKYDHSHHFLRRSLVPKSKGPIQLGEELHSEDCLAPQDIRIGEILHIYGRKFLIYDADNFTKEWFRDVIGCLPSDLITVDVSLPHEEAKVVDLPPHNGFGDPEDSAQNCRMLVPRPPRKIIPPQRSSDIDILRFSAKLKEKHENERLSSCDRNRRFILSYSLTEGTILVYEPPIPNSGIPGGRYFGWGKVYRNGKPGSERITEKHLSVGATIEICGRMFELYEADENTAAYLTIKTA